MKTLLDVLQSGAGYLAGKGVENSRLVMEQLMAHSLKCPRLHLYLRFETAIPEDRLVRLREGIKRIGAGEPLQYVLGDTEFMGRRFKTDKRALIPRPDTESLVEAVLACASLWALEKPVIVDVGSGSGCIVVSLALAKPQADYRAVDLSEVALSLARENAAGCGVSGRIHFQPGNLLADFAPVSLDAVVSNLPYITTEDCHCLPRHIREHEPMSALDGGPDGLDLIRRLIIEARRVLRPGGWIFLEIGFDQAERVVDCLRTCGFSDSVVSKDLGNRDRVVQAIC
ncbi:MAG: peptide chain release factor N(5)-glutamine methyltransferase [bacterium]